MKLSSVKKTALSRAKADRVHVSILVKHGDLALAFPAINRLISASYQKADWKKETKTHIIFVFRVKNYPYYVDNFFKELKKTYRQLRTQCITPIFTPLRHDEDD